MVNPEYSRDAQGNKIQMNMGLISYRVQRECCSEKERGIVLDLVSSMTDEVSTIVPKGNSWHCFSSTVFIGGCGYGNCILHVAFRLFDYAILNLHKALWSTMQ